MRVHTLLIAGFVSVLFLACGPNKPNPYQLPAGVENPERAQYEVPYGQKRALFFGPDRPAEPENLEAVPEK